MKKCHECNVVYENTHDVCPTCGDRLESDQPSSRGGIDINRICRNHHSDTDIEDNYTFVINDGFRTVINGAVAEINTQQFYHSKLVKKIKSIFAGEPYQLSPNSYITTFRLEEHTMYGYPEQAQDVTLYGNMRGVFVVGDDVTVRAKKRGNRFIAKKIYNHTTNSTVDVQASIPAGFIRVLALLLAIFIVYTLNSIASMDFATIGASIIDAVVPLLVIMATLWFVIKLFTRKQGS